MKEETIHCSYCNMAGEQHVSVAECCRAILVYIDGSIDDSERDIHAAIESAKDDAVEAAGLNARDLERRVSNLEEEGDGEDEDGPDVALTLTERQAAALDTLLEYIWRDELEDYRECTDDPDGNQRKGHIFESLVILDNAINGTDRTPADHLEAK